MDYFQHKSVLKYHNPNSSYCGVRYGRGPPNYYHDIDLIARGKQSISNRISSTIHLLNHQLYPSVPAASGSIDTDHNAAQRYDGELHVLCVVDAEACSSHPGDEYVHEFEGLEQAGRDAVESITDRAVDVGIEAVSEIRQCVPHEEILAYGDEADVDLTVVGSKNRPGEYRRLLGSVRKSAGFSSQSDCVSF